MCRGPLQLEPETVGHAGDLRNKCSAYGFALFLSGMESSHNTEGRYAFTPADPAYPIVARHLDVDISRPKSEEARESPLHGNLVSPQSRSLGDNSDVDGSDPQSANPPVSHDTSQKHDAVDTDELAI